MKKISLYLCLLCTFAFTSLNAQTCTSGGAPCSGFAFIDVCTVDCPPGQVGAITIVYVCDGAGGILSVDVTNACVLPVEFGKVSAKFQNDQIHVAWSTLSEINNDYFEIERSYDGINFVTASFVTAYGESDEELEYSISDSDIDVRAENAFYRIKQVDFDGAYSYSDIIAVRINENVTDFIFTQTTQNGSSLELKMNSAYEDQVTYTLVDMSGKIIFSNTMNILEGSNSLSIDVTNVPSNFYMVNVKSNREMVTQKIFIAE